MSVSCRRSDALPQQPRGFTLLELLVVLGLIAMMAALVAPRLQQTYDAIARSGERAEAVRQLELLPLRARSTGRAIVVDADDPAMLGQYLELPEGWTASALQPLRVDASGVCHSAQVRVTGGGAAETWTLRAPDCGIDDAL